MAISIQTFPFTVNQGETKETDWIQVSGFKRVRIQCDEKLGGDFLFTIAKKTVDPAQTTPVIELGHAYACGQNSALGRQLESDVLHVGEDLGCQFIKIAVTNFSSEPTQQAHLICET
jgi:hypothetical protein